MLNIALEKVREAAITLQGKAQVTPLIAISGRTSLNGNPLYSKAENLQPTGSFKIRGASYSLSRLTSAQRQAGVVAYSTGNHAQAVALAAKQLGISATIVMSPDAPDFKIEATRSYGAAVVMAQSSSHARREMAEELMHERGLSLIPPYDHMDVITGQGTIGLEIIEQLHPAAIFVPIGGGGLIAGIAAVVKQLAPDVQIIGVEPEWENDAYLSFQQGQRIVLPASSASIADAIRVQTLGDLTYPLICQYVDDIVTVSEVEIVASTILICKEMRTTVEPSGALGVAAALKYRFPFSSERPVVCIASGGNIAPGGLESLQKILLRTGDTDL